MKLDKRIVVVIIFTILLALAGGIEVARIIQQVFPSNPLPSG